MSVDALFPARAAVMPFFGEQIYPESPEVTWSEGFDLPHTALWIAEEPLRMLGQAGWRATHVHFTLFAVANSGGSQWVSVNLHERTCEVGAFAGGLAMQSFDMQLAITCVKLSNGGDDRHGIDLLQDEAASSEAYRRWVVIEADGGESLTVIFKSLFVPATANYPSRGTPQYWSRRSVDLEGQAIAMADTLSMRISGLVRVAETAAGSAPLDPTTLPGVTWLFDPSSWFPTDTAPPDADLHVDLAHRAAQLVWRYFARTADGPAPRSTIEALVQLETKSAGWSLLALLEKVDDIARNRDDMAKSAEIRTEAVAARLNRAATSPLGQAFAHSSYFDFICMLVQTGRISPPRLASADLIGHLETVEDDEGLCTLHALIDKTGRGEEIIILELFEQATVELIQTRHGLDEAEGTLTRTPSLRRNAMWEYKGLQHDDKHVIALTVGRGVTIRNRKSGAVRLDIYRAQSEAEFRWPKPGPADLDMVPVTDPDTLAYYDIPAPIDIDSPFFQPPMIVEDVSVSEAQTLDHDVLRVRRTFYAPTPDDLPEATPAMRSEGRILSNFSKDSPPLLIVQQLDNHAVRFEWYREGVSAPGQQTIKPTIAITLRPPDGTSGDFGYCYSLDYAYLTHRPVTEDFVASLYAASALDQLIDYIGLPAWLVMWGLDIEGDYLEQEAIEALQPFGVAFFRLWYSGTCEIDVERLSDSDECFFDEIVKVHDVMDLPQQGFNLPARKVVFGDYQRDPTSPDGVVNTGLLAGIPAYHAMLDDDALDIPGWTAANMPPNLRDSEGRIAVDRLDHVGIAESHVNVLLGSHMPRLGNYSDVTYYVVRTQDWANWKDAWLGADLPEDHRIPGKVTVDPTLEWTVFTLGAEVAVGFIPYIGDATDVAEFLYAWETGQDKWGEPVPTWQLVLMGIAAGVPFASSGMIKGGKALLSRGHDLLFARHLMTGGSLDDLFEALPRFWRAQGDSGLDHDAYKKVVKCIEDAKELTPGGKNIDTAAVIDVLRQMPELNGLAEGSGKALDDLAAQARLDLLNLRNVGNTTIRLPVLHDALTTINRGRATPLTLVEMLENAKYRHGVFRVVADLFELVEPTLIKKVSGSSQPGDGWAVMVGLVDQGWKRLRSLQLVDRLGRAGEAGRVLATLTDPDDIAYLVRFRAQIDIVLGEFALRGRLDFLIGTNERSLAYTFLALSRGLMLADSVARRVGSNLAQLIPPGGVNLNQMDEAGRLGFELFLEGLLDFLKRIVTNRSFQHAHEFELAGTIVLRAKFVVNVLHFSLQAKIGGKSGPDFLGWMADGFAIIQFKSLNRATKQFGVSAAQDNAVQLVTDLVRLFKSGGGVDAIDVPPGFVTQNRMNGRIIFVSDMHHLENSGGHRVRTLFEYGGNEVIVTPEMLASLPTATRTTIMAQLGELASEASDAGYVFNDLKRWTEAARLLNEDVFGKVIKQAEELQAADLLELAGALRNLELLQDALGSTYRLSYAERWAKTLAHVINESKNYERGTADWITAERLMEPTGAQKVFEELGLADGWQDTFKAASDPADRPWVPHISVIGLDELMDMATSGFRKLGGGQ